MWQEKNKRDTDVSKEVRIVFKKYALKQMILKDANNISRGQFRNIYQNLNVHSLNQGIPLQAYISQRYTDIMTALIFLVASNWKQSKCLLNGDCSITYKESMLQKDSK